VLNNSGRGRFDERRQRIVHFPKNDCPLHGLQTLVVEQDCLDSGPLRNQSLWCWMLQA
jgi:hypothetical protein